MGIKKSVELSHVCSIDDITSQAQALEAGGFYRVWVPDTAVSQWEPWLAASLIMQSTTSLQIGLGVTNPYTRHPVTAAHLAASMQYMSGGRLALSIGKGIPRFLEKAGINQHDRAVEEHIEVMHGLMSGDRFSFRGEVFNIDGIQLRAPVPDPPVPIYLAAVGPASWETAVRAADGVVTFFSPTVSETRAQYMAKLNLPCAALIPFALNPPNKFFAQGVKSVGELKERTDILEQGGFDEVIIGYADQADIDAAADM